MMQYTKCQLLNKRIIFIGISIFSNSVNLKKYNMAFSTQSLETSFGEVRGMGHTEEFKKNLTLAYDYLGGKISSKPVFEDNYENTYFAYIIPLFFETDEWTSNDQLLLDLLLDPDFNTNKEFTDPHISGVLNGAHTAQTVDKVTDIYKKLGYTDEEAIRNIIFGVQLEEIPEDAPVVVFLKESLRKSSAKFINSLANNPQRLYSSTWDPSIYILLEWSDKDKAIQYLQKELKAVDSWALKNMVEQLLQRDFQKFYPYIQKKLNELPSQEAELNYEIQISVARMNKEADPSTMYTLAEEFLNTYCSVSEVPVYERYVYNLLPGGSNEQIHISAFAVLQVLEKNKELGFSWIDKIIETKNILHRELLDRIDQLSPEKSLQYTLDALQLDTIEYGKRTYYEGLLQRLSQYPLESYLDRLWKLDQYKTKSVREQIALYLIKKDPQAEARVAPLLESKKGEIRQLGVLILSSLGTPSSIETLRELLEKEKNDDARDIMLYALGESAYENFTEDDIAPLIEASIKRGKLSKPTIDWLDEASLPPVYLLSGRKLTEQELRFIFYRMSRVKEIRSDIEVKPILALIDRDKSVDFSKKLFKLYADKGYDAKQKYLMALVAFTGNDEIVDKLRAAINDWIDSGRKVMSEYGIGALAIQGSNRALRWVEWYSRKFRSKKSYVGETAVKALQNAADELGITMNELGDRIVPDFGFEGLFKTFIAGGEEYRAFIDSKFKLAFFNEDNKKIKSVPASADVALKEEFKNIAKEVKDVVKSQSLRLEHYLVTQRTWKMLEWNKFFLENPVMFIYATKILWTVKREEKVAEFFICQEDTTLTNLEEEEISLEETDELMMAHPYDIQPEQLKRWQQKIFDLAIEPIFPQLDRKVTNVEESEKNQKIITKFEGKKTENGVIRSTLERKGWGKGATGDGGFVEDFIKDNYDFGIQAIIEVQGIYVGGYGYDHEPTLGRLYFVDKAKRGTTRWFDYPKNNEDPRLIALKDVPPVFYSEVMADLNDIKFKSELASL